MRKIELAAWMMIWLVIMLPVCFAEQLTVQKFSGADNVNGFAKENDELTVQVLAQMIGNPTPEVARQRARVYYADTYSFMNSCTAQAQAMQQCTYKTKDLVYGGTDTYTIKLFDSADSEIASVTKTLTVDFVAPKVISLSLSPNMSSAPRLTTVSYKVEDYGTETGKTTNCAGIKLINFTANTTQIALISANVTTCTKNGTFTFTPSLPWPNGKVKVCAVVTDYLNHKSLPMCKDILIDSRKPTPEALELRDSEGALLTHARTGQAITADVFVKILDSDVNPASVYADLSKLNPSLGKKPKDAQSGDWFVWRSVAITTPSTCQVTVNASDLMGNKEQKTLTCSIGVDNAGPEALKLATMFMDENSKPLLGMNGTIYAEFKEAGSGMSKGNAFLDLRNLGLGLETKADSCEKAAADLWKCYWKVRPTVPSGTYAVKILPTTRDNLNNQVNKTLAINITFDRTAPEGIRLVEIAAFRADQRVRTNVTALGEVLEFVVEGAGFTTGLADFRDLGGYKNTPVERCTGNLTKRCTFSVTTAVSGPQGTNITFDFSDKAGNKAQISTTDLFILGINNETSPNYWDLSMECSPSLLDRTTLSVLEHPVYCRIKMESSNSNAVPVTVQGPLDIGECTGQTDYISTMSVENNFAGSTEPYFMMTLVATDYTINSLSFNCPFRTLTRVGNFMPQNFENDNATVTLNFYNLPLGELADNMDDDVDKVKDSINGVWKVIGQLEKFMVLAGKFCKILNVVMSVIALVASVSAILGILGEVLKATGYGYAAGKSMDLTSKKLCTSAEQTRKFVNKEMGLLAVFQKFCDFLNCQYSLFDAIDGLGIAETGSWSGDWKGWMSQYPGMDTNLPVLGRVNLIGTGGEGATMQDPNTYLNVKDSLVFSIMIPPLCLPGIIYNLDKWRQIQCQYGTCLLNDVRQNGLPASYCKDQKHYLECRFVLGEIFNLIPFAPLVNFFLNWAQQILSNPLAIVGALAALLCQGPCSEGEGEWYWVCAGAAIASELGKTIDNIRSFKDTGDIGSLSTTLCDEFEDEMDDYEEAQET
jgi:hypothetical protein